MKPNNQLWILGVLLLAVLPVSAQPFSLNDNIQPVELALQEDNRPGRGDAKFLATLSTVDTTNYYYITGHDMFRFVDIIVKGLGNSSPLEASLVYDNWKDVVETQSSVRAEDGIMHFQVRAYGAIGLIINSPRDETVNFTIMASASTPRKSYLGNPFVPISDGEAVAGAAGTSGEGGSSGNNTFLYIALGIALLVIGLLAGKLMGRKSASVIALMLTFTFQAAGQGSATPGFFYKDRYYNGEDLDNGKFEEDLEEEMGDGYDPSDDISDLNDKLNSIKEFLDNATNLYDSYTGLGSCINSTPLPGEPRIPSFCDEPLTTAGPDNENSCAACFLDARRQFNEVRYLFEQLATIYKCTKDFSNAALSFGDNASGIHAVSGMAWQTQRRNIEKSIVDLEAAYDNKYGELLNSLSESMLKLSECEARYGVEDWFDRFGYMYFEFIKDKYRRKD